MRQGGAQQNAGKPPHPVPRTWSSLTVLSLEIELLGSVEGDPAPRRPEPDVEADGRSVSPHGIAPQGVSGCRGSWTAEVRPIDVDWLVIRRGRVRRMRYGGGPFEKKVPFEQT